MSITCVSPKIAPISRIQKGSADFDPGLAASVRDNILKCGGRVLGVFHPLFDALNINSPLEAKNMDLLRKGGIKDEDFPSYLSRMEEAICRSSLTTIIFLDRSGKHNFLEWLQEMKTDKTIFICDTEAANPTPVFSDTSEWPFPLYFIQHYYQWAKFAWMLKGFGVKRFYLTGEMAYGSTFGIRKGAKAVKSGCVHYAKSQLAPYWFLHPKVLPRLTFPNADVPIP